MHPPINPPVPRYFLPAKSTVQVAKAAVQNHDWKPHTTSKDVYCQTLYTSGILKHQGWLIKYEDSQLVVRDYPVIHSLWFDFETDEGASGLAVPINKYGGNERIRPLDSSKTLLDVSAGDELFHCQQIIKVAKVAIFRATPAPKLRADMPVFVVSSGSAWIKGFGKF